MLNVSYDLWNETSSLISFCYWVKIFQMLINTTWESRRKTTNLLQRRNEFSKRILKKKHSSVMSLHLSPQAELQSHLCDWCWLWISPSPPPACLFPGYSHFLLGENDNLELLRGDTAEFLYLPLLLLILWPVQRANTNQYPQLLKPTKTYGLFCAVFHNHIIFWQWLHGLLLREKEQFLWETNWKAKLWSWSSPGKTWMWWLQAEKNVMHRGLRAVARSGVEQLSLSLRYPMLNYHLCHMLISCLKLVGSSVSHCKCSSKR